jgi:UPF0271 protein
MKLDLNCDLGEREPVARTRALMCCITSANVACGGHAGDLRTMENCLRLAKRFGVRLGAHPGPWSRHDFGRGRVRMAPEEFELLLLQQVGALARMARESGVKLHHIKLHGALYHASEESAVLGRHYVEAVRRWWPWCKIYARAGGRVADLAQRGGVETWEEAFVDRNYLEDGSLVPRDAARALFTDVRLVRERVRSLSADGVVKTVSGSVLRIRPRTLCIHGDTPTAARLARVVASILRNDPG